MNALCCTRSAGRPGQALLRLLALACISALLAACAALTPEQGVQSSAGTSLGPPIDNFHVRGRASLRQQQRIDHFRFDWQHSPESDVLLITSPFGQGVGRMSRTPAGASLQMADGRSEHAESIEALADRLLGTPVPLAELADWLRGANPARGGMIGDWMVTTEDTDALDIPGENTLRVLPRIQSLQRGDVLLRLIIDQREGS